MKESIHIKNLGPIKDIFIDTIKPITVLIGESGSGKSTLMKAIALFRWIYKMQNIRSYLKRSKVSKSPFRFRMDTYFKNCGFEQYLKYNPEIIYTVEFQNQRRYTIKFANNKLCTSISRPSPSRKTSAATLEEHNLNLHSEVSTASLPPTGSCIW